MESQKLFEKKNLKIVHKERNYSKVFKNFKTLNGLKLMTLPELRDRIHREEGVHITPRSLAYTLYH